MEHPCVFSSSRFPTTPPILPPRRRAFQRSLCTGTREDSENHAESGLGHEFGADLGQVTLSQLTVRHCARVQTSLFSSRTLTTGGTYAVRAANLAPKEHTNKRGSKAFGAVK